MPKSPPTRTESEIKRTYVDGTTAEDSIYEEALDGSLNSPTNLECYCVELENPADLKDEALIIDCYFDRRVSGKWEPGMHWQWQGGPEVIDPPSMGGDEKSRTGQMTQYRVYPNRGLKYWAVIMDQVPILREDLPAELL